MKISILSYKHTYKHNADIFLKGILNGIFDAKILINNNYIPTACIQCQSKAWTHLGTR